MSNILMFSSFEAAHQNSAHQKKLFTSSIHFEAKCLFPSEIVSLSPPLYLSSNISGSKVTRGNPVGLTGIDGYGWMAGVGLQKLNNIWEKVITSRSRLTYFG